MKAILLGKNGWYASSGSETTSVLVYDDNACFILDAGTGLLNLKKYQNILEKYNHIHLFLSHYHYDHTIGLTLIDDLNIAKKLIIYGHKVNGKETRTLLNNFYQSPYTPFTITKTLRNARVKDYHPEELLEIEGHQIRFYSNIHTDQSYSISIDEKILMSTDNIFSQQKHDFFKFKLVFCEIWDITEKTPHGHTSVGDLEEFLKRNKSHKTKIVAIHQNPDMDELGQQAYDKKLEAINIKSGREHQVYDLKT